MFEKFYNLILKVFGDIKIYKFPFFLLYDPGSYLIRGEEIREVLEKIQPGDILIRGYKNYLDGYFIPGFFSHAGLYLGEICENDKQYCAEHLKDHPNFKTGKQMVIHSMAEGVFMEDILNFCRCDYMVILRRNESYEYTEIGYNCFTDNVKEIALKHLGKPYDFRFNFTDYNNLSCTEFVYVVYEKLMQNYGLFIGWHKVFLIKKQMLLPDDFIKTQMNIVWKSKAVSDQVIKKIKSKPLPQKQMQVAG